MEKLLVLSRDYWVVALLVLYFTLGRLTLLVTVLFGIGPAAAGISIIVGIELLQIPIFYHFFGSLSRLVARVRQFFRRRAPEAAADAEPAAEGFFMRRFKGRGQAGVVLLAGLPFKGCGVWSSVLLGRTLHIERTRIYTLVVAGTLSGLAGIICFALLFSRSAVAVLDMLNISPEVKRLFQ